MEDNNNNKEKSSKPNFISMFLIRLLNGFRIGYIGFKNPIVVQSRNFKMLADLLQLILAVAEEKRHYMTRIGYVHPTEGEQEIVSIWAGAGVASDPLRRNTELIAENLELKRLLSQLNISNNEIKIKIETK